MLSIGPKAFTGATLAGARLTERFSFKPAPLRAATEWRLEGDQLSGPQGSLDLGTVDQATLVDMKVQLMRMRRLDLSSPAGMIRIAINSRLGLPGTHPDRAAHRALCRAVAERLAERAPDLPVRSGEGGRLRAVWFGIGLLALVMGLGIGIAALATGVASDRITGMVLPLVVLVLFGAYTMYGHAPWRQRPTLPVSALPALLDSIDAPDAT